MLRCALLNDFKGTDTLLVRADGGGVEELRTGLLALREGRRATVCIEGGPGLTRLQVEVVAGEGVSRIAGVEDDVI